MGWATLTQSIPRAGHRGSVPAGIAAVGLLVGHGVQRSMGRRGFWVPPSPTRHPPTAQVQPAQCPDKRPAKHRDGRKTTTLELKPHPSPVTDTDCQQLFMFFLRLKIEKPRAFDYVANWYLALGVLSPLK